MPFTHTPNDAITLVKEMAHGIPVSVVEADVCDMVSSDLWTYRPWRWTITQITAIAMVDGTQDYSAPLDIYRLTRARLIRTDTTPDEVLSPLTIYETLEPDLVSRSAYSINGISQDYPSGQLRLSSAISVPTGATWELHGDMQPHPAKVTAATMGTNFWFPDQYYPVFVEGVKWKIYQLADDPRAGTIVTNPRSGQMQATGQLATYWAYRDQMAQAEDAQNAQPIIYPENPFGASRYSDFVRF